jgi:cytochrome c peroxidase
MWTSSSGTSRLRRPGTLSATVAAALLSSSAHAAATSGPPSVDRSRLPAELSSLTDDEVARILRMSPLPSLPPDPTNRVADDERAAELGHRLFFDTRLSPAGVSCATCHEPARHFTDGRPLARGIGDSTRNAPTVIDAARRRWTGWDGKFDSLWSQALSPIENPVEMGSSRARVVGVVRDDPALRALYESIFGPMPTELDEGALEEAPRQAGEAVPGGTAGSSAERTAGASAAAGDAADVARPQIVIDEATANILKSLGAYQRRLLSEPAPIDRFVEALVAPEDDAGVRAGLEAFGPAERRGLALFVSTAGCTQCHRGSSFTDEEFHNLGFAGANGRVADDPARLAAVDFLQSNPWNAAGRWSDGRTSPKAALVRGLRRSGDLFGQFRTPSLRGVAGTAPYMHDGRFATLDEVVRFYDTLEGASPVGHHGELVLEPLGLGEAGRADLVAFLRTLGDRAPKSKWTVHPSPPAPRTPNHAP